MTSRPLCIYHGNCADGFGAAWAVWKYYEGKVDLHAGVYGEEPPDVKGRDVIIVDFSYKRAIIDRMIAEVSTLLMLDHHKSAIEDLKEVAWGNDDEEIKAVFDTSRSGAMIAWNYFFPGQDAPMLIKHIQDRDLWKFELSGTKEIQAALFSFPYDMAQWNNLIEGAIGGANSTLRWLEKDGAAILRKHDKDIKELLKVGQHRLIIGGHDVPAANLPYTMSSEAGHIMAQKEKFAVCYFDTAKGREFSLRSAPDGMDVSDIAKLYGGGGHKHAAGFRKARGWAGDKGAEA